MEAERTQLSKKLLRMENGLEGRSRDRSKSRSSNHGGEFQPSKNMIIHSRSKLNMERLMERCKSRAEHSQVDVAIAKEQITVSKKNSYDHCVRRHMANHDVSVKRTPVSTKNSPRRSR